MRARLEQKETEGNRENGAESASVGLGGSLDLLFVNSVNFCGCHEKSQEPQTYAVKSGTMFLCVGPVLETLVFAGMR